MKEEGISFVVIPIEVFKSDKLTLSEKHLYGWVSLFKKQCCFMSNEALAEATGLSIPTISNGLKTLKEEGFIFIEYVNNDNSKRRIYCLFDNPAKTKYLMKKGLFSDSNKIYETKNNTESLIKNIRGSNKNYKNSNKIYESRNRGESNKIYEHKIKSINNNIEKSSLPVLKGPEEDFKKKKSLKRTDFDSDGSFEKAFYANNTIKI